MDGSRLDVTVTREARCRVVMHVAIPRDLVEEEKRKVTRRFASRVKVKGFRKGKIPTGVVAKRYGSLVEEEARERLVRNATKAAVKSQALNPVSRVQLEDVRFKPLEPMSFKASFDVYPTVRIGRLGGFEVERQAAVVPEGLVERVLEELREEHVSWTEVPDGKPKPGDAVTVVLTQVHDAPGSGAEPDSGQSYDFVLDRGKAPQAIEEAIYSLSPGHEREIDFTAPDEEGHPKRLGVRLVSRRIPALPELNKDFAVSVGHVEDMFALRAKIQSGLQKEAERQADIAVDDALIRLVLEANDFEIPDSMVEAACDSMIGEAPDLKPEDLQSLRTRLRDDAMYVAKRDILMSRIVEEYELRPTEEAVDAEVEAVAEAAGLPPAKVYADLQKSGRIEAVERKLTGRKVAELLRSQSTITQAPVPSTIDSVTT